MHKKTVYLSKNRNRLSPSKRHNLGGAVESIMIKGIAWDHRRCWGPLDASIAPFHEATGTEVIWDRRSLYSFGEGDLGSFCRSYDLVIYDHPFVGTAAAEGWLLDLETFLTPTDHAGFLADEVGASWRSYAYRDGIWGLPIDTAAQTNAWRPDLLANRDESLPVTLEEVLALGARLRSADIWIGWPAVPTDQMCTLISIASSLGLTPGHGPGQFITRSDATEVVGWLRRLLAVAHPLSREWNPIRCLDRMASADDVAYVPYLFNYVNYSTGASDRPIRFGAAPKVAQDLPARTLLGGAGIGVSASSRNVKAAFDYAMYLCNPSFQSTEYLAHGGQPGSRKAWTSASGNALTNGFFASTLPVLDAAYLRPTYPGFVQMFHQATLGLAAVLTEDAPLAAFVDRLNAEHERMRDDAERSPA